MQPKIQYAISMPSPYSHLFEVTLDVAGVDAAELDLALPVWTPGSYMVRDYARHIQQLSAALPDGRPLPWRKHDKSTWRIKTAGAARIRVHYQVYAHDLTVRTSHLDGSHGYFNPATLCLYVPGRLNEPHAVLVTAPDGWSVSCGLPNVPVEPGVPGDIAGSHPAASFVAVDYDELVDTPFECGTHRLLHFEVDRINHRIAIWGRGNEDEAQLLADTRAIVVAARDLFGGLPYRDYLFILHLAHTRGGGLEHRNSVSMIVDRWSFQPRQAYERTLGLIAHEFYHVWNVKRIRPAPLGPFDYSRENYTRELWVAEGITSYYEQRILLRAGLIGRERFLELLADAVLTLQSQPGRMLQSLTQSSFDAWIKFYRPDEHTSNSAVSYYLKGSLVALLLDLEIRQRTGGARSLDDVLRYLFDQVYGGPEAGRLLERPGFAEETGFRAAVETVAGGDYGEFFRRYVVGTEELDYQTALRYAGYQLAWSHKQPAPDGGAPAWLGLKTTVEQGRTRVASVRSDGPAATAGVYAGDELVAINGFRAGEERLAAHLAEHRPGAPIVLSLFRRDELLHVPVVLAAAPYDQVLIVPSEAVTEQQRRIATAWLGD